MLQHVKVVLVGTALTITGVFLFFTMPTVAELSRLQAFGGPTAMIVAGMFLVAFAIWRWPKE